MYYYFGNESCKNLFSCVSLYLWYYSLEMFFEWTLLSIQEQNWRLFERQNDTGFHGTVLWLKLDVDQFAPQSLNPSFETILMSSVTSYFAIVFLFDFFYCDRYLLMKMKVSSYFLQDLLFNGNQCNWRRNSSLSASFHIQADISCRKCISWNLCFHFIFSIWYKSLFHWKIAKPIFCFILRQ